MAFVYFQCFLEFCSRHKNLQVLQLQNCFPDNLCEPGSELAQGLAYVTKLKKISVSTKFFTDDEGYFIFLYICVGCSAHGFKISISTFQIINVFLH